MPPPAERFALGEIEGLRAAARIRNLQQVKVGGDVFVHGVVAGVRLREIEDQISAAFCDRKQ